MKKRKVSLVFIIGICLIGISFLGVFALQLRMHIGLQKSRQITVQIETLLPQRTPGTPGIYTDPNMPVLEIDDEDYLGLLEIPALGIRLPLADQWRGQDLTVAPGRYFGSAFDDSLVIGGGNYPGQFDFCDKIENGTWITVTDMTGTQFTYTVSRVDRAEKADTSWLTDPAYDLTLFCRDTYSLKYIAVRCNRK